MSSNKVLLLLNGICLIHLLCLFCSINSEEENTKYSVSIKVSKQNRLVLSVILNGVNCTHQTYVEIGHKLIIIRSNTNATDGTNLFSIDAFITNSSENHVHFNYRSIIEAKFSFDSFSLSKREYQLELRARNFSLTKHILFDGNSLTATCVCNNRFNFTAYLSIDREKQSLITIECRKGIENANTTSISIGYRPQTTAFIKFNRNSCSHHTLISYENPALIISSTTKRHENTILNISAYLSRDNTRSNLSEVRIESPANQIHASVQVIKPDAQNRTIIYDISTRRLKKYLKIAVSSDKIDLYSSSRIDYKKQNQHKSFEHYINFTDIPNWRTNNASSSILSILHTVLNGNSSDDVKRSHFDFLLRRDDSRAYGFNISFEPIKLRYSSHNDCDSQLYSKVNYLLPKASLTLNNNRVSIHDLSINLSEERLPNFCRTYVKTASLSTVISALIGDNTEFPLIHNIDYEFSFNRANEFTSRDTISIAYNFKEWIERWLGAIEFTEFVTLPAAVNRTVRYRFPKQVKLVTTNVDDNQNMSYNSNVQIDNIDSPHYIAVELSKICPQNQTKVLRIDWKSEQSANNSESNGTSSSSSLSTCLYNTMLYSIIKDSNRNVTHGASSFKVKNLGTWLLDIFCPSNALHLLDNSSNGNASSDTSNAQQLDHCDKHKHVIGIRCCRYSNTI